MRCLILYCLLAGGLFVSAEIPLSEREALIDLYESTNGDRWNRTSGWKDDRGEFRPHGTEHEWYGVSLDSENQHVVTISLSYNQLSGRIPESFSNLTQLRRFFLSVAQLSEFPRTLFELPLLESLRLVQVGLSGHIPDEWDSLPNLKYLFLDGNAFIGKVPESIRELTELVRLGLQDNALTELPDLSNLEKIINLEVHQNQISGPVPLWILDTKVLTWINLSDNQFSGPLPKEFATPGRPLILDLSDNLLTRFPMADWSPDLEIRLHGNLLNKSDCESLKMAVEGGTFLTFFGQKIGNLSCGVVKLRQSLPWVSNIADEWSSNVVVYNPSKENVFIHYSYPGQTYAPLLEIRGRSFEPVPLPDLESGYDLQIYSDNSQVFASYFVAGQHSASGHSPALTNGQPPENSASHLMFPVLPNALKAAFAIQAVDAPGQTALVLKLHGDSGLLGTAELTLRDNHSQALLLPVLFPDVAATSDLALEVVGPPEINLHGTAFAFNDLNEPAMMPAVPFEQANSDWVFSWAATNEQFLSQISVFNPDSTSAKLSITAIAPNGETYAVERIIAAGVHSFATGELFPQLRGYALRLKTTQIGSDAPQKVFANIQIGNREDRPSGTSPALTYGVNPSKLTSVVALPLPTLRDIPVIVLQAPNQTEPVEVLLFETGYYNDQIRGSVLLEQGRPKPIFLEDFSIRRTDNPILINAIATSGEPITGTVFYFNDYREPSMTQGVNQTWFDLSVSLNYQADEAQPLVALIENKGIFTSPEGIELVISADNQVIYSSILDPLGIGERVSVPVPADQLPALDLNVEMVAKIRIPSTHLDRDNENNQAKLLMQTTMELAHSHRLSETQGDYFTGVLHADEVAFEVFFSHLVLLPGDDLVWDFERLQVQTTGSYRDLANRFTTDWLPAESAQVQWDAVASVFKISSLETGAVYRIRVAIHTADGDVLELPKQVGLSKSAFPKASMEVFEQPVDVRRDTRVYHPFDNRNWLKVALDIWTSPTSFSGDELRDTVPLRSIYFALIDESELDMAEEYVLELPEGVFNLGRSGISFAKNQSRGSQPIHFKIQGAGKQKTFFTDLGVAPDTESPIHFTRIKNRLNFYGFDKLSLKDFAVWGATPGESNPMEVGGRANFNYSGKQWYPYAWFAAGMGINNVNRIEMDQVDFRFHSVALTIEDFPRENSTGELVKQLRNLSFAFCESGIHLRKITHVQVGPGIGIHHVSSQGLFGNEVSNLIIEGNEIDGARHRGLNLDRSSNIWIRNNTIRNSGQSGIHFGGRVNYAAVTGNIIQTVNRDRENDFGDKNSVNGTIMSYRPLYEGIKSVHGRWGSSSHLLIADNEITDVANGIAIAQGNASQVLIENNRIEAMQRGIRLEFGWSRLFVEDGYSLFSTLKNLFVTPDNQISLLDPVAEDNPQRHGIFFPDADPDCPGCNIDFMDSYGEDLGKAISYYPFPIEFTNYDGCGAMRDDSCSDWLSNVGFKNVGPVYLPTLGEHDYQHPSAESLPWNDAAMTLANEIRQRILAPIP